METKPSLWPNDNGLKIINRIAAALAGIRLVKGNGYWYWLPCNRKNDPLTDFAEEWLYALDSTSVGVYHYTHLPIYNFNNTGIGWINEIIKVVNEMRKAAGRTTVATGFNHAFNKHHSKYGNETNAYVHAYNALGDLVEIVMEVMPADGWSYTSIPADGKTSFAENVNNEYGVIGCTVLSKDQITSVYAKAK